MIGYEELYEKYQKLLDENKRLRIFSHMMTSGTF